MKLAVVLALGAAALWVSMQAASAFPAAGVQVPMILIITTIAIVLAQVPAVNSLRGPRVLGICCCPASCSARSATR